MHRTIPIGAALAAALALPGAASAHVTLQPNTGPAGGFVKEDVRVPNERDNASTTKVEVQLPPGFAFASYEAVPGWEVAVQKQKLSTPIKTDDGEITEQVRRITWTANGGAAAIKPGQFKDFPISVQLPGKAGDTLTFKALQTYSNGEVVRWIGAPGADSPAPQVKLTAAQDEHAAAPAAATPAAAAASDGGGASKGLAITALVLGALGVVLGGAALARRRA